MNWISSNQSLGTFVCICTLASIALLGGCQGDCGDGTWCPELEECDAGMPAGVECDASCRIVGAVCGDGIVEGDEACDDGFTDDCGSCNADCTGPGAGSLQGDGFVCPETEQCNLDQLDPDIDGVENCTDLVAVCGNGVVEPGEFCDDGFADECGTCNQDCTNFGSDVQTGVDAFLAQSISDWLSAVTGFFISGLVNDLAGLGSP